MNKNFSVTNWDEIYNNKVSAFNNKNKSINRWYPILEGFSNKFVEIVIKEQDKTPNLILDPFAGGGTTPLVAQINGIKCISFEVSPFMSQVCRAKLRNDYNSIELSEIIKKISLMLEEPLKIDFKIGYQTIKKSKSLKKWLFHKTALNSLLSIRKSIDLISDSKYKDLLYVTLGSITLEFCNASRDGKALRYKTNWSKRRYRRKEIYNKFLNKCTEQLIPDIKEIEEKNVINNEVSNLDYFRFGDCRELINTISDETIDLLITSPPYLNSRDYTDSHMVELWLLGHINDYNSLKKLRESTVRSHVQVRWDSEKFPNSVEFEQKFLEIMSHKAKFWNRGIPGMISGYFCDIEDILSNLKPKIKKGGKLYFNIANSSYFGVVIENDKILAEIADNLGYKVLDIRLARKIKCSSQQQKTVGWLRESIVVLEN